MCCQDLDMHLFYDANPEQKQSVQQDINIKIFFIFFHFLTFSAPLISFLSFASWYRVSRLTMHCLVTIGFTCLSTVILFRRSPKWIWILFTKQYSFPYSRLPSELDISYGIFVSQLSSEQLQTLVNYNIKNIILFLKPRFIFLCFYLQFH